MTPTAWWRVPMGTVIGGLPTDPRAQYRLHKMMLQQCQYARPKKYWVLKGFHGARLAALFEAYPDARIIWTHRDPVQVIASRIRLIGELVEGLAGEVDWTEQARIHLAASRASFNATMNDPMVGDPRIHHVRYPDFIADPVGTIRGYYDFAGVPFTPEADAAMRGYLRDNRGDRYGKFHYSADLIGEDLTALHAEFAPYRERFGLEIEHRSPDASSLRGAGRRSNPVGRHAQAGSLRFARDDGVGAKPWQCTTGSRSAASASSARRSPRLRRSGAGLASER
jgi:hypothetical protein